MPNPDLGCPLWELLPAPDGRSLVAFGADGHLRHHDLQGRRLRTLGGHDGKVAAAVFDPDGQRLLSAGGREVRVWDWASGACQHTFRASYGARSLVVLPSGLHAISGHGSSTGTRRFQVWNLETLKRTAQVRTLGLTLDRMRVNPEGSILIAAQDATAGPSAFGLWRLTGGRPSGVVPSRGHTGALEALALSPAGDRVATGDSEGRVGLWDGRTGQLLRLIEGHRGWVRNLVFTADGATLLTAGARDESLRLWEVGTGRCLREMGELPSASGPGLLAVERGTARAAVGEWGGEVALVNLGTGRLLGRWSGLGWVSGLAFVGGQLLAASDEASTGAGKLTVIPLGPIA